MVQQAEVAFEALDAEINLALFAIIPIFNLVLQTELLILGSRSVEHDVDDALHGAYRQFEVLELIFKYLEHMSNDLIEVSLAL